VEKPILGITMGDAAGIGPELILKAFKNNKLYRKCRPLVLGSLPVLEFYKKRLKMYVPFNPVHKLSDAEFKMGVLDILDLNRVDVNSLTIGEVAPEPGNAAVFYTQEAGKLALAGLIDAIVSAPLNKESMLAAGYNYEGQTQIFAKLSGAKNYGMILLFGNLKIMMLTTHMALRKACRAVTKEKVLSMIKLADRSLRLFGISHPKIAVAGLNPHAGERGLFGDEEIQGSIPAIQEARAGGIDALGPIPADIIFVKAKQGEYDLVLAMYHDQANMAAKLLGFGEVVTLLAGIPIIRTSVGHGTAFDIAGKGIAKEQNLIRAIEVAADMVLLKKG
jgi:4-hydroxythreonine-4-phosphate dehydrogenase